MFRRLLALCLIFGHLAYAVSVFADGHGDGAAGHNTWISIATDQGEGDGEHSVCDHCCHASYHLTAVFGPLPLQPCDRRARCLVARARPLPTLLFPPPTRPPKA